MKALDRVETDVQADDARDRANKLDLDANALQILLAHQLGHEVGQVELREKKVQMKRKDDGAQLTYIGIEGILPCNAKLRLKRESP